MNNLDTIRAKLLTQQSLPEGYGRSVVGGREIITAPTQKAEENPTHIMPSLISKGPTHDEGLLTDGDYQYEETQLEDENERDIENNLAYESLHGVQRINGFREQDLKHQYESLLKQFGNNDLGQKAINQLMVEDSGEDEGLKFLKEAVKYGRGSK